MIAIQNVEEELAQPLVNLLALNKNVLILIHFVHVSLIVKSVNVYVLVHRQNICFGRLIFVSSVTP